MSFDRDSPLGSIASLILMWPFQCKRQFYYSSGCPVNSISKGQKSGDCGLDGKQKCTVSFLSPSNRDHSELVGWPSFWFSVLWEWEWGDGSDRTGGTKAASESNHACPRGCWKQNLSSHVRSIQVSSQITISFTLNFSSLSQGCVKPTHRFFPGLNSQWMRCGHFKSVISMWLLQ